MHIHELFTELELLHMQKHLNMLRQRHGIQDDGGLCKLLTKLLEQVPHEPPPPPCEANPKCSMAGTTHCKTCDIRQLTKDEFNAYSRQARKEFDEQVHITCSPLDFKKH